MPATADGLVARCPQLFHMAARDSWPSIVAHGLLSASALLDLFEIEGDERRRLEAEHRPESVTIEHEVLGAAVIRDQKPMRHADLHRALRDGLTPEEWYRILNNHVFFWPTEERLERMLGARAYRDSEHLIITVDTVTLLDTVGDSVRLSRLNSGATIPFAHPRGRDCFLPMAEYPFAGRARQGLEPVAEIAVVHSVPSIVEVARLVEIGQAGKERRELPGWGSLAAGA